MSSVISATAVVSRPKIHRLPNFGAGRNAEKYRKINILTICAGLFFAGIASVLYSQNPHFFSKNTILKAALLPQISVGAQDGQATGASFIGDAQAAVGKPSNKVIALHDDSEHIVGQMAKIPADNEQIVEIKSVNDIDNRAGRELLSIISKY